MRVTVIARWKWISIGRRRAWGELPAIVCIHGGGWAKGNRVNHRKVAQALAARGFVAATISYRLSGEAPFPAAIHDCKAAVRFLRANAEEYGIDTENIGAIGLSAGGHLTALLATSAGARNLKATAATQNSAARFRRPCRWARRRICCRNARGRSPQMEDRGKIWRQFLGGSQAGQAGDLSPRFAAAPPRQEGPALLVHHGRNRRSQHARR